MADEIPDEEVPRKKPTLKIGVTGCLAALGAAAIVGVIVGLVLRWWG